MVFQDKPVSTVSRRQLAKEKQGAIVGQGVITLLESVKW